MKLPFKNLFSKISSTDHALLELEDASLRLLEAQSGLEYARAMVEYHSDRVERLTAYVKGESGGQSKEAIE
jgi:hypothetical protein